MRSCAGEHLVSVFTIYSLPLQWLEKSDVLSPRNPSKLTGVHSDQPNNGSLGEGPRLISVHLQQFGHQAPSGLEKGVGWVSPMSCENHASNG